MLIRPRLKCNREQPCDTCSNRGLAQSCTYVVNPAQRQASRRSPSAQDRIQHLEGLVVSLMEEGAKVSPTQETHITTEVERSRNAPDSSSGATQNSAGHPSSSSGHGSMKFDDSGAKYVGSSHWAAVLDGIADLKGHLEREDDADVFQIAPDSFCPGPNPPQLLSGYTQHLSKEGILASIPARSVVDRLLSRYFNSFEVSPGQLSNRALCTSY